MVRRNNVDTIKSFNGLRELALFAGAGGGILGGHSLGWRTVCAVEYEQYPQASLCARQNDKSLEPFPIWDDVRTFDGRPWRGIVDVVSGGFPCQDISCAGKGAGIADGARSGLWREMARIICEVRPRYVFVENSPMLVSRGLGLILGDLAEMGYDAEWGVLSASDVGANHKRERMWILGIISNSEKLHGNGSDDNRRKLMEGESVSELGNGSRAENVSDTDKVGLQTTRPELETTGTTGVYSKVSDSESERREPVQSKSESTGRLDLCRGNGKNESECISRTDYAKWWQVEPNVGRVADELASRVERLKAIGNGQVPLVASRAFCELHERLTTGVVKW